jgi:hypothetical protein
MLREYQVASNPSTTNNTTPYENDLATWKTETWGNRQIYLPPPYGHDIMTFDVQQYFEMIGKYFQQFGFGWRDTYPEGTNVNDENVGHIWTTDDPATLPYDGQSPLFFQYRDMRGEANDLLNKGNVMMEIVLVNHVLSALDAAFAVRGYNKRHAAGEDMGLKMEYDIKKTIDGDMARFVKLSMPLNLR